ncbi:transcriptional regulator [Algoriphagus halophytocola]|uniref:transcriptional regulator n=1 Tax=Algoriphagus halophytocola TaxID=2991499 RepID=UPI0022DD8B91|nr:transcriptional regulator [Algoriphagus sp. TR-M9]WBL43592.1 transcriptional regulator [Algoriphagus sp. TR-M9]
MKRYLLFCLLFALAIQAQAQLKFLSRHEVPSELYDPVFEMVGTEEGVVSFRTVPEKGLNFKQKFQYFISDLELKSESGLIEFPVKDGYQMIGYDYFEGMLYVLFAKGYNSIGDKYVLQIELHTKKGLEFDVSNVLEMELTEFLVQERKVIFMGTSDSRPVLQILDLDTKSVHTLQGIYGNDTQIMQIRKMPESKSLEVVLSRKGVYKNRDILINTYDLNGNLLREVKVDQFGEQGQGIMDGMLVSTGQYQEAMIGAFGLERRNTYQGMYIMDLNEFGEYNFKLYTLEDFPNFYNYLEGKSREKREADVLKDLDKEKTPEIINKYAIRDIRQKEDAYYIYFDQFTVSNNRSGYIPGVSSSNGGYRYDRWSRMGNTVMNDPIMGTRFPSQSYQVVPEFRYQSAHFVKVSKAGPVLWDNASTYNEMVTTYPEAFGEIAVVGEEFYHMFVENLILKLSYFNKGEKIFENLEFEIKLINENERIQDTNVESLRLIHWYDRYYLMSGTQKIRYQANDRTEQVREVFFLTKILVDGDLYQPEELPD